MVRELSPAPSPEQEPSRKELLATLRRKFKKLARWGLLASALSGLVPQELAAQEAAATPAAIAVRFEKLEIGKAAIRVHDEVGQETLDRLEKSNPRLAPLPERGVASAVPLVGFEKRPKAAKAIRETLATMPESITAAIARIRYDARLMVLPAKYGITKDNLEAAHTDPSTREITFSAGSDVYGPILTADALQHEACHVVSPEFNERMNRAQRIRTYANILERVNAPDRFRSSYVEEIANPDSQARRKAKADEYWAEICGAFLRHDMCLPEPDIVLVGSVLADISSKP